MTDKLLSSTELKSVKKPSLISWHKHFSERQLKEIDFCRIYARNFSHGTDGHNAKLIIAKMAELLDKPLDKTGKEFT